MRRRTALALVPAAFLLLVACDMRQTFPQGYTDTDLWTHEEIRIDTEVPGQYPNGTTRNAHDVDSFGEDAAGGGAADEAH